MLFEQQHEMFEQRKMVEDQPKFLNTHMNKNVETPGNVQILRKYSRIKWPAEKYNCAQKRCKMPRTRS